MTQAHLQLLVALLMGFLVLAAPLALLVRVMRRDERRARIANAPVAGLFLAGHTCRGRDMAAVQAARSLISFVFIVVLASVTGLLMLIAAWGLEPRRRWREWRVPRQ